MRKDICYDGFEGNICVSVGFGVILCINYDYEVVVVFGEKFGIIFGFSRINY